MSKQQWIRILLIISRIILGTVFIFSGFVKGVDPMGSMYKFTDYFSAFGLGFMGPLALFLAYIMSAAEFLIGISLLLSLRFRLGAWAILIFMSFFTILTLILALTNPVTDCGCFGDALIMTNWQTFLKNCILLPFVFVVFRYRGQQAESLGVAYAWTGLIVFGLGFLGMEINANRHLPLLDFRPYSTGTYIPAKMTIPEGAPQDVYQTLLYYEKDGEVKEFTEDNFPWQDSTWTFVDTRHTLISQGYEPPIHDFNMADAYGVDVTSDVLADPGYSFLFISTHLEEGNVQALQFGEDLNAFCQVAEHSFYCLTASGDADIEKVRQDLGLGFDVYTTDEITLKTIVRSNPGLLLLREGTILYKWHYNDFPEIGDVSGDLLPGVLTEGRHLQETRMIWIALLCMLLLGFILMYVLPAGRSRE